jgi:hypothetical protein
MKTELNIVNSPPINGAATIGKGRIEKNDPSKDMVSLCGDA